MRVQAAKANPSNIKYLPLKRHLQEEMLKRVFFQSEKEVIVVKLGDQCLTAVSRPHRECACYLGLKKKVKHINACNTNDLYYFNLVYIHFFLKRFKHAYLFDVLNVLNNYTNITESKKRNSIKSRRRRLFSKSKNNPEMLVVFCGFRHFET